MKVRSGPNPRMLAMGASCIARRVHQGANDTGTMPAFGASREGYARANAIDASSPARKVKVVKGVRRITYR
jgi:hypothetical protein